MLVESAAVQLLVNPVLREKVRPYMTKDDFQSEDAKAFYQAIMAKHFLNGIPKIAQFTLELHRVPKATKAIIRECVKLYKGSEHELDEEDLKNNTSYLSDFIRASRMNKAIYNLAQKSTDPMMSSASKTEYANLSEAVNFTIADDDFVNLSKLSTIVKAREEVLPEGSKIIKSRWKVINNALTYKGFKYGDLIMVAAEPGIGKTTYMINEAANFIDQGLRVCHVFIGDMDTFDVSVAYTAMWSQRVLTEEIAANFEQHYTEDIQRKFKKLRVRCFASSSVDVLELISKLKNLRRKFKYDVLIVDYDANLKPLHEDNMYQEGGSTYGHLKGFGKGSHCTFIISQTKPAYWGVEQPPKDAPNESSKKQMHVDGLIIYGRNPDCRRVGTVTLCKIRRGEDFTSFRLRLDYQYGKFVGIDTSEYDRIVDNHRNQDSIEGLSDAGGFADKPEKSKVSKFKSKDKHKKKSFQNGKRHEQRRKAA